MRCLKLILIIAFFSVVFLSTDTFAAPWFLGIGNDGYIDDVNGLWNAMSNWPSWSSISMDHVGIYSNLNGDGILEKLDWLSSSVQSGDMAVFFYSGHGTSSHQDINGDETAIGSTALNSYDEAIGLQGYLNVAREDQIAAQLLTMPDGVYTITIFDACHAGGMVGGINDLNSVDHLTALMASAEDRLAYGGTPFSQFTGQLIDGITGTFPADLNMDGMIFADEWFDYVVNSDLGESAQPQFYSNCNENPPLFEMYPVPVPPSIYLLALGLIVVAGVRNRSKMQMTRRFVLRKGRPGNRYQNEPYRKNHIPHSAAKPQMLDPGMLDSG